jgi:Activator of Hsp90 ATPase homolog 1-like protein
VTSPDNDTVEHVIWINARPETVWRYWTDPERICDWWGVSAELDPRPGGTCLVRLGDEAVIACGDLGAARIGQAADHGRVDLAVEVEHQQIFLGRRGGCFTARIADEFEVPRGIWPPDHQQRMPAFR